VQASFVVDLSHHRLPGCMRSTFTPQHGTKYLPQSNARVCVVVACLARAYHRLPKETIGHCDRPIAGATPTTVGPGIALLYFKKQN
jgi:hypothetical protein